MQPEQQQEEETEAAVNLLDPLQQEQHQQGEVFAITKPLDLSILRPEGIYTWIGKRRRGKTLQCRHILYLLSVLFYDVYVFTHTKMNSFWTQHVPDEHIIEGIDEKVLEGILMKQKNMIDKMHELGEKWDRIPYVALIFEDVADDAQHLRWSNFFDSLGFNGRHYWLCCFNMVQDFMAIGPKTRGNTDIVAVSYQSQNRQMEAITKDYADWFPHRRDFNRILQESTRDFQFLYIDQGHDYHNPLDSMMVFTADVEPPPFRLGALEVWQACGCNWEEQLNRYAKYKAVLDRSVLDWTQLALEKRAEEQQVESEMQELEGGQQDEDHNKMLIETNDPFFARGNMEDHTEEPQSHWEHTMEMLRTGRYKLGTFIHPGSVTVRKFPKKPLQMFP